MKSSEKFFLFILRVSAGWFFFYAGLEKILNPKWSAVGYMKGATTFSGLYTWLMQPDILTLVNSMNKWGLALLGISLILGIFVRLSSVLGALLMILYYFPMLNFPYVKPYSYIIDERIVLALVLIFFAVVKAGRIWGLDSWCARLPICSRYPRLRSLLLG